MATTLVTVGRAGEDVELVDRLALLVSLGLDVEDRGGGDAVGGEASLREGLTAVRLLAQEVAEGLKELLGGAKVLDLGLVGLLLQDDNVVDGVTVVLVAELEEGRRRGARKRIERASRIRHI